MNDLIKEPPWLQAKVDQRIALMKEKLGNLPQALDVGIIMMPLTEPTEHATPDEMLAWERSCDNCLVFCAGDFYTGHVSRNWGGQQIVITFGVCPVCKGGIG